MQIISGQAVDLITPFPPPEIPRIYGWNHCYRTLIEEDLIPQEREAYISYITQLVQSVASCGIIDKGQLTSARHEAPLVGLLTYEPLGPRNGVVHFAAGRKAFKMGLVEEALVLFVACLFENFPEITRISGLLDEANAPAKSLLRRLGFRFEGVLQDSLLREGEAKSQVLFGLTRRVWAASQPAAPDEQAQPEQPEPQPDEVATPTPALQAPAEPVEPLEVIDGH